MTESNVERIFQAVLSCPHQITGEEVVLGYSDSKPGKNALAQLHSRIAEALALRTPSDGVKVKAQREELERAADAAMQALEDWHHVNIAEYTGWGDGEVPPVAEQRLAAVKAARDALSPGKE